MILDFSQNINIESLFPKNIFEEKVISFLKEWFSEAKTVRVQTSGSTGRPKVFEIEKEKMRHSAKMTCDFLGLEPGDTALLCLPVEYISGKMMLVRAIERKLKIFVEETSSQPHIQNKVTFCAMTPLQVQQSLDKIHLIKNLIIGGATVSENLKRQICHSEPVEESESQNCHAEGSRSISSNKVFETYGMSETLSHIALKQISPIREDYFTLLEGVEISVDERGCLKISAPQLNPEILQTNDLVELKNEKQFKFLGRYDNVINSGGVKIFAEELESLVKAELGDAIHDLVFLGKADESLGEKLILVIELPAKNYEIQQNLKSKILNLKFPSRFHIPKEVIFLDKFPRSENGKVFRKEILKRI